MNLREIVEQVDKLGARTARDFNAIVLPDFPGSPANTGRLQLFEMRDEAFLDCRVQDDCLIPLLACNEPLPISYQQPITLFELLFYWEEHSMIDWDGHNDQQKVVRMLFELIEGLSD